MAIYAVLEDDIKPGEGISIEQNNKESEEAEAEFEKGGYIIHQAMLKQVEV